ncbi:MAG: CRTAC1 family protein [Deltaproteobacteria bacterium]|nr:CRTAC1 family protein [Deltaproteobacteria bacterium]
MSPSDLYAVARLGALLGSTACAGGGPKAVIVDEPGAALAGGPPTFAGPGGAAQDGGVEVDHLPWPSCAAPAGPPRFWLHDPGPGWSEQGSPTDDDAGGWGLAVDDFNDDGHLDLFLPDFGRSFLFLGDGRGQLHPAHDRLPDLPERASGALSSDLEGDGLPDLIVLIKGGPNLILRNTGDGFTRHGDPASTWGEAPSALWTAGAGLGDLDGDGLLDLVTATFLDMDDPDTRTGLPRNGLWRGQADANFLPIHEALPSAGRHSMAHTAALVDANIDGVADLYMVNDKPSLHPSEMFWGGPGGLQSHADCGLRVYTYGMGLGEGDLNGDGWMDYAISGWGETALVVSDGAGGWANEALARGLTKGSADPVGWGLDLVDIDRDGDLDVLVANGPEFDVDGSIGRDISINPPFQPWTLSLQGVDGRFTDGTAAYGLDLPGRRRGFIWADLDEDGQPELIAREIAKGVAEIWTQPCSSAPAVELRLSWPGAPNHEAVGAELWVEAGGRSHRAAIRAGGLNLASSGPRTARLSLPGAEQIDQLRIRWPDGLETTHLDLPIQGQLLLTRPGD